jgi:hypothetical protein
MAVIEGTDREERFANVIDLDPHADVAVLEAATHAEAQMHARFGIADGTNDISDVRLDSRASCTDGDVELGACGIRYEDSSEYEYSRHGGNSKTEERADS